MSSKTRSRSYDLCKKRDNIKISTDRIINRKHAQEIIQQVQEYEKTIEEANNIIAEIEREKSEETKKEANYLIAKVKGEKSEPHQLTDSLSLHKIIDTREQMYHRIQDLKVLYGKTVHFFLN